MHRRSALVSLSLLSLFTFSASGVVACKTRTFESQSDTEALVDKTYELSLKPAAESQDGRRYFTFQVCKKDQTNCYSPLIDRQQKPYRLRAFTQKEMDDLRNKGLLKGAAAAVPTVAAGAMVGYWAGVYIGVALAPATPGFLGGFSQCLLVLVNPAAVAGATAVNTGTGAGIALSTLVIAGSAELEKVFSTQFIWGAEERQLAKAIPALDSSETVKVPSIRKLIPVLRDAINKRATSESDKAVAIWIP